MARHNKRPNTNKQSNRGGHIETFVNRGTVILCAGLQAAELGTMPVNIIPRLLIDCRCLMLIINKLVGASDGFGMTPLHYAVKHNQYDLTRLLLCITFVLRIIAVDIYDRTALSLALNEVMADILTKGLPSIVWKGRAREDSRLREDAVKILRSSSAENICKDQLKLEKLQVLMKLIGR
ncbi:hypothetical protein BDV19DRAFT_388169 [Aspergillus venezuelensis]